MPRILILSRIITLLILALNVPLETKAEHKNNLIKSFCIASIKSKFKFNDKNLLNEISHYSCECFLKKFKSGSSIKTRLTLNLISPNSR